MILETKLIKTRDDIYALNIIDFNRLNGVWAHQGQAMDTIYSWLSQGVFASIVERDLTEYPERLDFPDWEHVGHHEGIARLYWNWFCVAHPQSEINFSDAPDFQGVLRFEDGQTQRFWGDIGVVSASTFSETIKQMSQGDLWISLVTEKKQIVLEFAYSPARAYMAARRGPKNKLKFLSNKDIKGQILEELEVYREANLNPVFDEKPKRKRKQRGRSAPRGNQV